MSNAEPVPDETFQRCRKSHPEAGVAAKPRQKMRRELGSCGD